MIINSFDEYKKLVERMDWEDCVVTPIFRDLYYHPRENPLLCVGITFIVDDPETYVLSISHADALEFQLPNSTALWYTPNSKALDHDSLDIHALMYINNTTPPIIQNHYPKYVKDIHNNFGLMTDVNRIIPLTVWASVLKEYNKHLVDFVLQYGGDRFSQPFIKMQDMLQVLRDIEKSGIRVDKHYFGEQASRAFRGDLVYSEYNPYTATGRPSNRFGGINFSAIKKEGPDREMFTSRYETGQLVYIDFEAYHLRLIADDLQVQLPEWGSIHSELAKIYFKTDDITPEMYAESKRKTFEVIYGMGNETYGIELFERINAVRQQYTSDTITLPSGITRVVDSPNPSKLFNYYVQSLEVVKTIPKLRHILNLLYKYNQTNHLVLYTYDSILLDMKERDDALLEQIVDILEEGGKFPVRTTIGRTYGEVT